MKQTDFPAEPWFPYLEPSEQASLQEWEAQRRKHRDDAGTYARWIKQATDRAKKRQMKEENKL